MRTPLTTTLFLSLATVATCTALAALAQQAPSQPAPPSAAPPLTALSAAPLPPPARGAVLIDEQGKAVKGVRLERADVRAVVRGPVVQATVTLSFANTENRVLGGELVFPLPEGATVTGYGLEVNGSMVDGVAVEKQQARDIYERESQKRVDPGLVEHVAGNTFRTRLYPIPAKGSRSARVQYVTEVACTHDGATLSLPMGWGKVGKCTVRVEVPDATAEPALKPGAGGLAFHRATPGFVAEGELTEVPDELVVALVSPLGRSVLVARRSRDATDATDATDARNAQSPDGRAKAKAEWRDPAKHFEQFEYYFVLNDTPPAPPAGQAPEAAAELRAKRARRVAILWDAGLSRAESDKSRELKLLESLLKGWGEANAGAEGGSGGGATGDLVVFRDTAEPPVRFDCGTPDGRAKVIEQLARLTYDGASDLGQLPLPKNASGFAGGRGRASGGTGGAASAGKPASDYDCLLLFTDGMGGIGPEAMRKAHVPVFAFSDDARANHALLEQLCRDSGGRYVDLRSFSGDATREPWSLLSVECKPDEVAEVYPIRPIPVEGSGRLTLTGRLLTPQATVTLNYGYGNRVTKRQRFTIRIADATAGDLVPRYWAQQKLAELSPEPDLNDKKLAEIGRRFNLVTPNTSLLVLETADQYVRYRVVPPKNQPLLYQQYLAETGGYPAPEQQTPGQKLWGVLTAWSSQVHWWEDPKAFAPPVIVPPSGNTLWGPHKPEDRPDPRTAERRATAQRATDLRRSRELAHQALQARRSGDLLGARDLYAEAVVLGPGNSAAARGFDEVVEALTGQDEGAPVRVRLAQKAGKKASESASAFRAALVRSGQDIELNDLEGADFEIDQAREALDANPSAWSRDERKEFDARLSEAKHGVDAARLAAARNAPVTKAKRIADAHADRARDPVRRGVNNGGGYSGRGYGGGYGGGGGGGGLFGGNAGDPGTSPPATTATPSTAQPPGVSIGSAAPVASIALPPWDPAAPWRTAMKEAPADRAYDTYLEQRRAFGRSPAFYLDCGDYLERAGQHAMAVRVVTDVAAFHPVDARLLRRAAFRLQELGELQRAIELFERVLEMRPEEPQGYHDLATALSDRADALADLPRGDSRRDGDRIAADYGRCLDLLNQVLMRGDWSGQIEVPSLMEANRVIAKVGRLVSAGDIPRVPVPLDPRLIRNLECDLRVVLTCDTDEARPALSVVEPNGDTASASRYATRIGGRVDSVSGDYGLEEYCLRTLSPGRYRVQATFFGGNQRDPSGPCTLRATVFTDFGRANEKKQCLSVRVNSTDTLVDIGVVMPHETNGADGTTPQFRRADNFQATETAPKSPGL